MSFILDALKKAEEDRQAGQAPPVSAVVQPTAVITKPSRVRNTEAQLRAVIAMLGLVVVLGAGAAAWHFATRDKPVPTSDVAAVEAAAAADAEAIADAEASDEAASQVYLDAPDPTSNAEDAGQDVASMDDLMAEDDEEAALSPEEVAEEVAAASAPASGTIRKPRAPAPADESMGDDAAAEQQGEPAEEVGEPSSDALAVLAQPVQPSKPRSKPAPPPGAKRLSDMPPAFRTQFPVLTVEVHNYDADNPLKRFVIINGRKYRETDTLVEGPRLLEITPGGVVLDQSGTKVIKSIPR